MFRSVMSKRTVLLFFAVAAGACNAILGIEDRNPRPDDDGGVDGSAGDGANGEDALASGDASVDNKSDGPIEEDAGEGLAIVVGGPGGFAIDRHEVTVAEYGEFRATAAAFDAGLKECTWNASYEPSCTPSTRANAPMTCIDWCDAYAYCVWKGKRLCGRIGGTPQTTDDFPDAASDEWTRACAGGLDSNRFAYGPTGDPLKCNVQETDAGGLVPTGSMAACVGATPGVFDLSGNAWEWENACLDGGAQPQNDGCTFRGGCYANPLNDSKCSVGTFLPRNVGSGYVGFRCCKSL
jgi:formylglycine-generating enzyme